MFKFEVGKKYYDTGRDMQIKIIKRTAKMVTVEFIKGVGWFKEKEVKRVKIANSFHEKEALYLVDKYYLITSDPNDVITLEHKQQQHAYDVYYY